MKNTLPLIAYVCIMAFAPLVYTTARTISRTKLKDTTFLKTLVKDYLRTLPICGLVLAPALAFPEITRVYAVALHLLFAPLLFLEITHVYLFKKRIGLNTFYSLFVSNMRETREFIAQNVTWLQLAIAIAAYLGPLPFVASMPTPQFAYPLWQWMTVGIAVTISMPLIVNLIREPNSIKDGYVMNPYVNTIYHYFMFRCNYRKLQQLIAEHTAAPFSGISSRLPQSTKETYVIVIGESANAQHFGCYGYPRHTTEFTDRLGKSLIRVANVRSPFAQTIPSLEKVLSFADAEHEDYLYTKGSIIDYFNDAGFTTYWYSNQYALDDTAITAITSHAKVSKCFNFSGMKRFEKAGLDGDMLPEIKKTLENDDHRKVLFVHLIGSHSAYVNRYPDEFHHFEGQAPGRNLSPDKLQFLNAYDDSIRYTDWLVAEIAKALESAGGVASMLYFSDHGEDIFDSTDSRILGHSQLANLPMTSIPFMVWLSQDLRKLRPDLDNAITANAYNLQEAIHTIIDLASLDGPEFDKAKSIFRQKP